MPFGSTATVAGWIAEGARIAALRARIGPSVYVLRQRRWERACDVPRRGIDTILAEDDRIERLLEDAQRFFAGQSWYAERCVPWRRGYLLYGPPGTGKSSAIRALASELDHNLAVLDIGKKGLGDDDLVEALSSAPRDALFVLEDIDAVFSGRQADEGHKGISFSGLLNAIDGVAAQEGRALIMTTNHRDRLDPALIRPGRADLHVELGLIGGAAAARLFARFFPQEPDLAAQFERALGGARLAPAAVQGWLLAHRDDAACAARAEGLHPPPPAAAKVEAQVDTQVAAE
ncbi:MAG: AAA family ATPase [Pseudomonadota bacterium]